MGEKTIKNKVYHANLNKFVGSEFSLLTRYAARCRSDTVHCCHYFIIITHCFSANSLNFVKYLRNSSHI